MGKSTNIKSRVLSHFANGEAFVKESALFRQTAGIEAHETAGELGALLLESRLIKELMPLYNRRSRAVKRLLVGTMVKDESGYATVRIDRAGQIDPQGLADTVGIFKSLKQAQEFLWDAAREQRLCPRILGLEKGKGECSYRQLENARGHDGLGAAARYNLRFALAMKARSLRLWPFSGPILIEEKDGRGPGGEVFLVDRWCPPRLLRV